MFKTWSEAFRNASIVKISNHSDILPRFINFFDKLIDVTDLFDRFLLSDMCGLRALWTNNRICVWLIKKW